MNDYLSKPVEPKRLAATLGKWLATPPRARQSEPPQEAAAAPGKACFHPQELLARLGGDEALARKIITAFLQDVPQQLGDLKKQLAAGNARGARLAAHALKGAAATVAAPALHAVFSQVQEEAAAGRATTAQALLPTIEEQFERLQSTLKQSGWA